MSRKLKHDHSNKNSGSGDARQFTYGLLDRVDDFVNSIGMGLWHHRWALLFALLLIWLYFRGAGDHGLIDPIEGINASVSLSMYSSDSWLRPHIGASNSAGRAFGHWWLGISGLVNLGWRELAVRFWSILAGLGCVWLASLMSGWMGAAVCASMTWVFLTSQIASPHALYALCLSLALYAFWRADDNDSRDWLLTAHLSALAGLVVYGPEGLLVPWLIVTMYAIVSRRLDFFMTAISWWLTDIITIVGAILWVVLLGTGNPMNLAFMTCQAPDALPLGVFQYVIATVLAFTPWSGFAFCAVYITIRDAVWEYRRSKLLVHKPQGDQSVGLWVRVKYAFRNARNPWDLFMKLGRKMDELGEYLDREPDDDYYDEYDDYDGYDDTAFFSYDNIDDSGTGVTDENTGTFELYLVTWAVVSFFATLLMGDSLTLTACVVPIAVLTAEFLTSKIEINTIVGGKKTKGNKKNNKLDNTDESDAQNGRGVTLDWLRLQVGVIVNILLMTPVLVFLLLFGRRIFPVMTGVLMSFIPWAAFNVLVMFSAWHYVKTRQEVKFLRNTALAALVCLLPLAGMFNLVAERMSPREVGLTLRKLVKPGDNLVQYAANRPSLYFYTSHDYMILKPGNVGVNSTVGALRGVAMNKLSLSETALQLLWPGNNRTFLVLLTQESLASPMTMDAYNLNVSSLRNNNFTILSNKQ